MKNSTLGKTKFNYSTFRVKLSIPLNLKGRKKERIHG
jgi:hypothetical protein